MGVNMTRQELLVRLEEVKDRLVRRQDDNLKAWSQTQLWPERAEGWLALDRDLQQICGLVDEYYLNIDAFWGTQAILAGRPVLLRDSSVLLAFQELSDYCEQIPRPETGADVDRGRLRAVQRLVWSFLLAFPAAHAGFVAQLAVVQPVVADGLVVVD